MQKHLSFLIMLMISFILFLIIDDYLSLSFSRKIESYLLENKQAVLNEITEFSWDKVCLYPAYEYRLYEKDVSWVEDEGVWTLEFVSSEKVSTFFKMSYASFDPIIYKCFSGKVYAEIDQQKKKLIFLTKNET